jgi:predicted Ser/Thr protein kinase
LKSGDTGSLFPEELVERYEVLRELGRGGMGRVFLARDRELDRRVAIKVLLPAATPRAHSRLVREAQILADLHHPNVIEVLGFGETERGPYVEMEYLEGATVDRGVMGRDPGELMLEVADALQAAHDAGVIHRDVKASNILVTREGRPVLLDFGLALDPQRTRLSEAEALMGTLPYLSPEALRGEEATAASDWYAWGLTLFVLREGEFPYTHHELVEALSTSGRSPTPTFTALDPDGPEAQAIVRCLDADPRSRPGSARELRAALEGRGPAARTRLTRRPGVAETGSGDGSSRSSLASGLGLAVLVAAGFLLPDLIGSLTGGAPPGDEAAATPTAPEARPVEEFARVREAIDATPALRELFARVDEVEGDALTNLARQAVDGVRGHRAELTVAVAAVEKAEVLGPVLTDASRILLIEELLSRRSGRGGEPLWEGGSVPGVRRLLERVVTVRRVGEVSGAPGQDDARRVGQAEEMLAGLPGRWRLLLPRRALVVPEASLDVPVTTLQVIGPAGRRFPHLYEGLEELVPAFTEASEFDEKDEHSMRHFLHRWSRPQLDVPVEGVPDELPLTLLLILYSWPETHHLELDLVGRDETVRLVLSPWDHGAGSEDWFDPAAGVVVEVAREAFPEGLRSLRFRARGMPGLGNSRSAVGLDQVYLRAR